MKKGNMAKKAVNKKQKSIEDNLWDSANKLRGNVEPSEYKHVVLSLIFLKFASDKFEDRRQELVDEGEQREKDNFSTQLRGGNYNEVPFIIIFHYIDILRLCKRQYL